MVFIDETGTRLGMTQIYGRSLRGQRVYGTVMRNKGSNLTILGALSREKAECAMIVEGSVDKNVFLTFINKVLIPCLKPGQIVIMDNFSVHKIQEVKQAIEKIGCRLIYQPPYSPEVNPIEEIWSKINNHLRKAGAKTKDALINAIGQALNCVSASNIFGWFKHAGYCTSLS